MEEGRLTVFVGNTDKSKLLGVPSYLLGTKRKVREIISDKTINLLQAWNCVENIVNTTCDTTASNTGHVSAAYVTIQQQLG
jgi:hypothetical protein